MIGNHQLTTANTNECRGADKRGVCWGVSERAILARAAGIRKAAALVLAAGWMSPVPGRIQAPARG